MKTIKSATFISSYNSFENFKGYNLPEIIIVGRSNVGKSSLINMLGNNNKLAKVSSTQGKTKLANFFMFNNEFILVDLPGYGYSEAGKTSTKAWGKMIDGYFAATKNLKMAILLVDIRHTPTEDDIEMLEFFAFHNIPVSIVCTKYDKIKPSELAAKLNNIAKTFNVGRDNLIVTSSEKSYGKDELVSRIYQFVGEA